MGNILTSKEQKALKPHLQGIEPASLAAIIWDSINFVGVDDDIEKLGIHFVNGTDFEESGQARVIFWDDSRASELPRRVFLEILLMVGQQLVNEYESNYDLETATDLGTAVNKLQLALLSLHETIDGLSSEEGAKAYRERVDSGAGLTDYPISDNVIEKIRTRRGSYMWTNGEPENDATTNRRQSKGIEGVIDRLPELRRRYDKTVGGSSKLDRVKNKIKILTLFQKGTIAPNAILEEEEGIVHSPPSSHSLHQKLTQDDNILTSSTMLQHSISRSSSVCSYESASSSKQLLHTDSPHNCTQRASILSPSNIKKLRVAQNEDGSLNIA